jgi:LPS-assembly lipoprotein
MWWHDMPGMRTASQVGRAGFVLALLASAGCTVQPLYASRGFSAATQERTVAPDESALGSVEILPVSTRVAQEVRNQLLFLLNGGGRKPESPRYTITLTVTAVSQSSASIQVARDEEPTAAQVALTASYVITDNFKEKGSTPGPVAQGKRQMLSAYDVPRQEFAVARARRDAEDRAAREMAELLRLAIAQDLLKVKKGVPPTGVPIAEEPDPADTAAQAAASQPASNGITQ